MNRTATFLAIATAALTLASAAGGRPRLEELLAIRGEPQNPFFRRA